jgi:hypothetical protein
MTGRSTLITSALNQTAVYWADPTPDGYGGETFAVPVEIAVRWEQAQVLFVDPTGNQVLSEAVVYVDAELDLGGYLYLGTLDDLASGEESEPADIPTAREIRGVEAVPDLAGATFVRRVFLRRG